MLGRRAKTWRWTVVAATAVMVSVVIPTGAAQAVGAASAQHGAWTCRSGSIPGGVYASITVRGIC